MSAVVRWSAHQYDISSIVAVKWYSRLSLQAKEMIWTAAGLALIAGLAAICALIVFGRKL